MSSPGDIWAHVAKGWRATATVRLLLAELEERIRKQDERLTLIEERLERIDNDVDTLALGDDI